MAKVLNKPVFAFLRVYRLLFVLGVGAFMGLILTLAHHRSAADLVLGAAAIIAALSWLVRIVDHVRTNGVLGADFLSLAAVIAALMLREFWSALVLAAVITLVRYTANLAARLARTDTDAMLAAAPRAARVQRGKKITDIPARLVRPGDRVLLEAGDIVPVDSIIIQGFVAVDEHILTGNPKIIEKNAGDLVVSGSQVREGEAVLRAEASAADSHYGSLAKFIRSAAHSQTSFMRQAAGFYLTYSTTVILIGIAAWILTGSAIRFLGAIIIAATGQLLISPALTLAAGINRLFRKGVVVRTGTAMERMAKARSFAFRKPDVLTEGRPVLKTVHNYTSQANESILSTAAAVAGVSSHALSRAITAAAEAQGIHSTRARHARVFAGQGITATVGGKKVVLGRLSLLERYGIEMPAGWKPIQTSGSLSFLAVDQKLAGAFDFQDNLRASAPALIRQLHGSGVRHSLLLTGEPSRSAKATAKKLRMTQVEAEALPADKLRAIEALPDKPVAYVGTGQADAPLLTAADVGIAFNAYGFPAATDAADVVILSDNLHLVALARDIARSTYSISRRIALSGSLLGVLLALIGAFGLIAPLYGTLVHGAVDFAAIMLSLRLPHSPAN